MSNTISNTTSSAQNIELTIKEGSMLSELTEEEQKTWEDVEELIKIYNPYSEDDKFLQDFYDSKFPEEEEVAF